MKTMYNTTEVIPGSVFMSGSLWLNKTCTYAEDCSDQNTICYNTSSTSVCLCTPGYFYSNSCNTCVPGKQINHQSLKYVPDKLEYFFNIKVPLKSYPTFPSSYLHECPLFLRRMWPTQPAGHVRGIQRRMSLRIRWHNVPWRHTWVVSSQLCCQQAMSHLRLQLRDHNVFPKLPNGADVTRL